MNPTAVITGPVAVVMLLNLIVGISTALAQHGQLGPITVPAKAGPWLLTVGAFVSGVAANLTPIVKEPGFHFTMMVVVGALLAGGFAWLTGEAGSAATNHRILMGKLFQCRSGNTEIFPEVSDKTEVK